MNHWDALIAQRWPCGHVKQWDTTRCTQCLEAFKCGHPRTEENMFVTHGRHLCLTCKRSNAVVSYHRHKKGEPKPECEQ